MGIKMKKNFFFIEPENKINPDVRQPASYIRRTFEINKPVTKAELKMSALGVYVGYLNGTRLSKDELLPGYTDYHHRVQYQSYDVTALLEQGKNVVAAIVGDGWYRGGLGAGSNRNGFGEKVAWMCHLEIHYEDGDLEVMQSDENTLATQNGPLRENDLKINEIYDARMELGNWLLPQYDDSTWHGVSKATYPGIIIPHEGVPVLPHETFEPNVLYTPNGETVLDFGQNMSGKVWFHVSGNSGHSVELLMGEVLDENGNFTQKNLKIKGTGNAVSNNLQRLKYTLKEGAQEYSAQFLICGFRYVKLDNWPEQVHAKNFRAIAIYSSLPETGNFTCSNPMINQFFNNVKWSQKSNFVDIPTDCPTRERVGWTADISVFAETACYLTHPKQFLTKWLHDYKLEQQADGNLPFTVPNPEGVNNTWGCMGWSNGIANIAMTLYQFYGEKEILDDVYDTVKRFIIYNCNKARVQNLKSIFKSWKDREYIIDTGFHFGEWLEPGSNMVKDYMKAMIYPDTEVTTAWFFKTTEQLAKMADILGHEDDYQRFHALSRKLKEVYKHRFLKNGCVSSKRQCKYVRPLSMNLVDGTSAEMIAAKLNEMCIAGEYKIGTGFLTTWQVLQVLTDYGYVDTAYKMLENTKQPGWLYAVSKGATTVWENWEGITENEEPVDSHNHYAPGAVVAWLFSHCAGIRPLKPGFEEVLIKPFPGGSLTFARAEYESCKGTIVSEWKCNDDVFILQVKIPDGVHARIELPDGTHTELSGGKGEWSVPL